MGGEIREGFLEEMVADLRCGGHVGVIWVEGGGKGVPGRVVKSL